MILLRISGSPPPGRIWAGSRKRARQVAAGLVFDPGYTVARAETDPPSLNQTI
jgi:hypothetical protein